MAAAPAPALPQPYLSLQVQVQVQVQPSPEDRVVQPQSSLLQTGCLFPVCPSGESGRVQVTDKAPDPLPAPPGLRPSSSLPGPRGSLWAPHIHHSHSLTLEWNNLGTWEDAFATFCGALSANGTLRQLDLRNNQISHKGAEALALALKNNASLQQLGEAPGRLAGVLCGWFPQGSSQAGPAPPSASCPLTAGFLPDLRWNNIGLLGGRALVNCLPGNRTLWRLDLAGNSVPSDVLRAVGAGTVRGAGPA